MIDQWIVYRNNGVSIVFEDPTHAMSAAFDETSPDRGVRIQFPDGRTFAVIQYGLRSKVQIVSEV